MQVGDFDTNDIDYIEEEYSNSVGAIIQGVATLGTSISDTAGRVAENKTELERNLKAQCGKRPIFKKKRSSWQKCIDKVTGEIKAQQESGVNLQKSAQESNAQIQKAQIESAKVMQQEKQKTNRLIIGGILGGVAVIGILFIVSQKR
jgi:SMC interacting uncharacterized protein involved in chromosome segregation